MAAAVSVKSLAEMSGLPPALQKIGVLHERWEVEEKLPEDIDRSNLSAAHLRFILKGNEERALEFERTRGPIGTIDVVTVDAREPDAQRVLKIFKKMHYHTEPEVRLIQAGEAVFEIRVGGIDYPIHVGPGSFIILPAHVVHNFTAGSFTAIRSLPEKEGWVAHFVEKNEGKL